MLNRTLFRKMVSGACLILALSGPATAATIVIGTAESQNVNNLQSLAIAMENYRVTYNHLPGQSIQSGGLTMLSWRVSLLPFLGYNTLFNAFDLSKSWDSAENLALLSQMPEVFRSPGDPINSTTTRYVVGTGSGTLFDGVSKVNLTSITDGTSNTLLIGEAATGVAWTKPEDILVTGTPAPTLGEAGFGSITAGYVPFAFADGSIGFLPTTIPADLLRQLFLKDDGSIIETSPAFGYTVDPRKDGNRVSDGGAGAGLLLLALAGCVGFRKFLGRAYGPKLTKGDVNRSSFSSRCVLGDSSSCSWNMATRPLRQVLSLLDWVMMVFFLDAFPSVIAVDLYSRPVLSYVIHSAL